MIIKTRRINRFIITGVSESLNHLNVTSFPFFFYSHGLPQCKEKLARQDVKTKAVEAKGKR